MYDINVSRCSYSGILKNNFVMFKKAQFEIVFNTLFFVAFSITLILYVKYMRNSLTFDNFIAGLISSFTINFVLEIYIPLVKIGNWFAEFLLTIKKLIFYFLKMFIIVFIMTLLILW